MLRPKKYRDALVVLIALTRLVCGGWSVNSWAASGKDPHIEIVQFIYPVDETRDPFFPLLRALREEEKEPSAGELFEGYLKKILVNGVIWDKETPLVMINNEIYHLNDEVEHLRISEITPLSVTMSFRDLTHTIQLIDVQKFEEAR